MTSYADDFNRADSTDLGANWTEFTDSTWAISGNRLAAPTVTTAVVLYTSALATDDHYVEAVFTVAAGASMGVVARSVADSGSYYLLRNNGTEWTLFANIGGSFTSIGQYVAAMANGDVVRLSCQGSAIKAFINSVERISVTNTAITSGKFVGFRSAASATARYDSFAAADMGAVTGTLAATLPALAGALVGQGVDRGALAGVLAPFVADLNGTATARGSLFGLLPALAGGLTGGTTVSGVLTATLPVLVADLGGTPPADITLTATLAPRTRHVATLGGRRATATLEAQP